jgi:hypothetical protein
MDAQTKPQRPPYSTALALAMARAQKRLAADYQDEGLKVHADELERRALKAAALGLSTLPDEPAPKV